MCGITGVFSFNPVGRIHLIHLEAATNALEKRGPDVHRTWFDEVAGLGHRRLSIIDTSEQSNQPFFDETQRYAIVYNGEVYNYQEIRKRLQDRGLTFRTNCDTEVVLKAYIEFGPDCVKEFNGFFAFAIYDKANRSLYIARDRFGIKPLLYIHDNDKLLFASEMKSLLAYNVPRKLDRTSLYQYMELTYVPDQYSMLEGVQKVPPGSYMLLEDDQLTIQSYYDLTREQPVDSSLDEAMPRIRELMRDSVRRRLIADVPLGAFLSGGIDSSIIVALASEMTPHLKTFSVGFEDNNYFDETHYAELVAKKFHTEHTVFRLRNSDLLTHVEDIVNYLDEPFADSSAIPFYILSKLTRDKITVALSGDGADEVFSGYNKHQAWEMSKSGGLRNQVIGGLGPLWSLLPKSRYVKVSDRFRQLDKFAKMMRLPYKERYWYLAAFIPARRVDRLLSSVDAVEERRSDLLSGLHSDELNEMLRMDMDLVLRGDMLRKGDMMSMANGLEVRVPFLDHAVVNYAFSLPAHMKLKGSQRKILLREAFREMLPPELYTRPKHGFEVPIMSWFKKELKSELQQFVFNEERVREQGLFAWPEIKRIKRRLYSLDPSDVHIQIWSLYVFQKWYARYFNN